MKGRSLISIGDLSKEELLSVIERAQALKKERPAPLLQGKIMASCFFESSTRTRLSFESAMKRLGGEVIGFSDSSSTSQMKGEALDDMMRVIGMYSDVIVMRSPIEKSAELVAKATSVPVINAGDGSNEHPSQTLLDLFTIYEAQGRLDGLHIAFVGDLLHSRTVHSLALALRHFDSRLYFVAPHALALPDVICRQLRQDQLLFSFHRTIEEVVGKVDILYMTRLQKERFSNPDEHSQAQGFFRLTPNILSLAKSHMKVLHPLPRLQEIDREVDKTPFAYYFPQAENGLYVRQAILTQVFGK